MKLNQLKHYLLRQLIDNLTEKVGKIVYNFVINRIISKIAQFAIIIGIIIFFPFIVNALNLIASVTCIGTSLTRK